MASEYHEPPETPREEMWAGVHDALVASGDPLDESVLEIAADYHRPPETPREEMWAGVHDALVASGDPLDESVLEIAADYHRPPETPREEMWAGVHDALVASGDPLDESVLEIVAGYHRPPETPREEMWPGIDAVVGAGRSEVLFPSRFRREGGRGGAGRNPGIRRWAGWSVAAAALLVLGIGIGRVTKQGPEAFVSGDGGGEMLAGSEHPGDDGEELRPLALRHLSETESLLTLLTADARAGRVEDGIADWAGRLLLQTRVLKDSSAGEDATLRPLLEDLEVILAQVARLPAEGGADDRRGVEELSIIAEGLEKQDMLLRIQTVLPVGAGPSGA